MPTPCITDVNTLELKCIYQRGEKKKFVSIWVRHYITNLRTSLLDTFFLYRKSKQDYTQTQNQRCT